MDRSGLSRAALAISAQNSIWPAIPVPTLQPRRNRAYACRQQPKHSTKNVRKFVSATIALHVHRHPQTPC